MDNRVLPHDFDSEIGLLNACFCLGGIERVVEIVATSDFYSESGKLIFAKMVAFHKAGLEPTLFQVDMAFQDHRDYLMVRRVLDELRPITAECATHFANTVKRMSDRRKAILRAYILYLDLHDPTFPLPSDELQSVMAGGLNG
jgi:replicative DNA helicase